MEFNNMNLDELLSVSSEDNNTMTGKLFENVDLDVTIVKEEHSENLENCRKEAMEKLAKYEEYENNIAKLDGEMTLLNQQLEALISEIKLNNKELIDKINAKANEISKQKEEQDKIKEELLPLQREVYNANNEDKTLKYNKIQSTYVAPTEKNQFDLKKFRENEESFWKENIEIMEPYSKITPVSDYLKVTISKK